jgi:purine-nucleoside phosphorylase
VPIDDKMVLVFGGRAHLYEGLDVAEVVHPLRTGIASGCSTVILTAAVGGLRPELATGSVVTVSDQINLTGRSPLLGPQFIDMADAYAPALRKLTRTTPDVAAPAEGVYAQVLGPQFETEAEVAMLRQMGADVVGMSMAIETIAARHAGISTAIAQVGAEAAPTVAAIVRHVVGSLP